MTLKPLISCTLIAALAVACDVEQDLGETASSSTTSGGSGSGSSSAEDTGVLDTGPWSGTSDGTTGSAETGVLDTGPWSGTTGDETGSSGTTGEIVESCEASDTMVTWDWTTIGPGQLGYQSLFVGVGDCGVLDPVVDGSTVTLSLQCTLSGTRDDEPFADEAISLELSFQVEGAAPETVMPSLWPAVRARFYVGGAGLDLTGDRYVVLEQPMLPNDADAPVILATDSTSLAPAGAVIGEWFVGDWYGGPSVVVGEPTCSTTDAPRCTQDVAIEAGWLDRAPILVHGSEAGSFGAPTEGGVYDLFVTRAWQAAGAEPCPPDFPTSYYEFVALGATPQ